MSIIAIILQIILALPQVLKLVMEIISLVKQIQPKEAQRAFFKETLEAIKTAKTTGDTSKLELLAVSLRGRMRA